ncbi:MAG: YraN family protein [Candidatus Kuenenbacteria bacterium]
MQRKEKGKLGENIAVKYLKRNKFKIIKINFYSRFGEIDIIAFDKIAQEIVFIEVKARSGCSFGYPEEAVGRTKIRKMYKTAQIYLQENEVIKKYRFDCLAIELDFTRRKAIIRHYKGIAL